MKTSASALAGLAAIGFALAAPASAQLSDDGRALIGAGISGDQFDAAVADFRQDGSQGDIILETARLGHPTAARVLASECLYNDVCPTTRKEAHDILAETARTHGDNAVELGMIYHWGKWGEPDDVMAARWIAYGHEIGAANGLLSLSNLPAEAVEAAGASHLLAADTSTQQTSPTGPVRLSWAGHAGFPVFADTRLSNLFDAAMSCHLVYGAEVDAAMARWAVQKPTDPTETRRITMVNNEAEFALNLAKSAIERELPSTAAANPMVNAHKTQMNRDPASGPTVDYCIANLVDFHTDTLTAAAEWLTRSGNQ
ncbi:hypothetical protein [Henriciella litoralis]|uniref:hypothetical protein n=1 Tax=Henriciella litoralis TaxID=568102 RepID=UPI0009FE7C44|nr:hypothetical protein [Henriciella litoralis]